MEERGPPSTQHDPSFRVYTNYEPDPLHHPHNNPVVNQEEFDLQAVRTGTYVVQVPKDQIYRVPPPENALIAERHRNFKPEGRTCFSVKCVLSSVIIVVLVIGLIAGIILFATKKDDPKFDVEHFHVMTKGTTHQRQYEFDVTLGSKNPNGRTLISFDKDGKATLSFKVSQVAHGHFPSFDQVPNNSTSIKLSLMSMSGAKLPKEMEKSMNGTDTKSHTHVELSLGFKVPLRMMVGPFEMKSKTISVSCNFKVDKLAKNARVLSQECV